MMRAALVTALCLATAAAWSRLEIALQNYPRVHDRNLRAFDETLLAKLSGALAS